jgi:NAD(P)-dependent dehydrogenase (short-subunit alcohol dehydrogenase family)
MAVARMFDLAQEKFGGVDVLVNNGGIMKLQTMAQSEDDLFDSQIAINLKGTFTRFARRHAVCATEDESSIFLPAPSACTSQHILSTRRQRLVWRR